MKKFKVVLKNIGIGIGIFLSFFVAALLLLFTGINILYEKNIISDIILIIIAFSGSFIVGAASVLVFFINRKKTKYKLFSSIGTKILFSSYLVLGFLTAFKTEIILSQESAQKLVEIEWTIFSIAITVFIFWHVFVSKFIENKPNKAAIGKSRIKLISQKLQYYKDAGNFFYNLILLIVALMCLTFVTASVYIMDINYYIQFVTIFNIHIVIDALMIIFRDISIPLCAELFLSKKYKMTDQQVADEIMLALTEDLLKSKFENIDVNLMDDQITDIAKEALKEAKDICDNAKNKSDDTDESKE